MVETYAWLDFFKNKPQKCSQNCLVQSSDWILHHLLRYSVLISYFRSGMGLSRESMIWWVWDCFYKEDAFLFSYFPCVLQVLIKTTFIPCKQVISISRGC